MDVRASTSVAEGTSPAEFARLMNRFYEETTRALVGSEAFIDKFVGDEVMAVYLPVFCGPGHAQAAIRGARGLLSASKSGNNGHQSLPIGIGVNTGVCYFGAVKGVEGTFLDFTALGDPVNVAARLASAATAGEALVSDATCRAAGYDFEGCERRTLFLKGKTDATEVRCLKEAQASTGGGPSAN